MLIKDKVSFDGYLVNKFIGSAQIFTGIFGAHLNNDEWVDTIVATVVAVKEKETDVLSRLVLTSFVLFTYLQHFSEIAYQYGSEPF